MIKFAIFLALVAAATASPVPSRNPLSPTDRIVGGVVTSIEEAPYQVSLQFFGSHICGGVIISNSYVLTAAHCMVYPNSWYTIRSGSTFFTSGGTVSAIAALVIHEHYAVNDLGIPIHDIALIQLSSTLTFSSTQAPIALYEHGQESVTGAPAVITGWGAVSEGGIGTVALRTVTVPIISKADCSEAYSFWGGIPEGQICAGVAEGGLSSCQGDSGGPVTIDGVLAGIVSWGNGCARPGYPSVYSEVAAYRTWISTNSGV